MAKVVSTLLSEVFEYKYVASIEGDACITEELLQEKFDYIFFTGSQRIGKSVMTAAAKNLTPVTLELGGKSPVIIDSSADIYTAAKRIIWGKTVNNGQTCIAPDYVLVPSEKKEELIREMEKIISQFYGTNPEKSQSYGKIVNLRHWKRIEALIKEDGRFIVHGGNSNYSDRKSVV